PPGSLPDPNSTRASFAWLSGLFGGGGGWMFARGVLLGAFAGCRGGGQGAGQDFLGDLAHGYPAVHRGLLNPAERLRLGQPAVGLEAALRPVEELANLQALAQRVHFGPERSHLLEAADRDLDRWHQVRLGERLHQVGHRARVAGPLDEFTLG